MRHVSFFLVSFLFFLFVFLARPTPSLAAPPTCETVKLVNVSQSESGGTGLTATFSYPNPTNDEATKTIKIGVVVIEGPDPNNKPSSEITTTPLSGDVDYPIGRLNLTLDVGTAVKVYYGIYPPNPITAFCTPSPIETKILPYNSKTDPGNFGRTPATPPSATELLQTTKDCTFNIASADPCVVQQNTFVVRANIQNIPLAADGTTNYFYCLKSSNTDCDDGDLKDAPKSQSSNGKTGSFTLAVCGDGKDKLKTKCDIDGSDWFWAGSNYRIHVYDKKDASIGNNIATASFRVAHFYPEIIEPKPGHDPNLNIETIQKIGYGSIVIKLSSTPLPNKNNFGVYWIQAIGYDNNYYSHPICLIPELNTNPAIYNPPLPLPLTSVWGTNKIKGTLTEGPYKIVIKEGRISDDKAFIKGEAQSKWCKEESFTFYHIPFSIGRTGNGFGIIAPAIKDPFGEDTPSQPLPTLGPVCTHIDDKTGYCLSIPTGLGIQISTRPQLFMRDIFTIVLSIGGIAAIVFFVQAGYTLMTSAGNKEKIGAAREQITAAIMGLVFIILSITILEFIGVNILHIPGFGN